MEPLATPDIASAPEPGLAQRATSLSASVVDDQDVDDDAGPQVAGSSDYFHCFTVGNCSPPSLTGSTKCREGRDYDVNVVDRNADVAVLSFHGGDIEPESSELAKRISNEFGWSRYDFSSHPSAACLEGTSAFSRMHITSTHFDDATAVELVERHRHALSIHGYSPSRNNYRGTICVGGANAGEIAKFIDYVDSHKSRFTAYTLHAIDTTSGERAEAGMDCSGLSGTSSKNIVNRAGSGNGGLQLEMNDGIKEDLLDSASRYDALRSVFFGALGAALGG
jgi:phage replication-related protein YjqB (UPF0714/DUF867 family)